MSQRPPGPRAVILFCASRPRVVWLFEVFTVRLRGVYFEKVEKKMPRRVCKLRLPRATLNGKAAVKR